LFNIIVILIVFDHNLRFILWYKLW